MSELNDVTVDVPVEEEPQQTVETPVESPVADEAADETVQEPESEKTECAPVETEQPSLEAPVEESVAKPDNVSPVDELLNAGYEAEEVTTDVVPSPVVEPAAEVTVEPVAEPEPPKEQRLAVGAPGTIVRRDVRSLEGVVREANAFKGGAVVFLNDAADVAAVKEMLTGSKHIREVRVNPRQEVRALWRML